MMIRAFLFLILPGLAACGSDIFRDNPSPAAAAAPPSVEGAAATDSATSMTWLLRRFQSETPHPPQRLADASDNPERLAGRFISALERGDAREIERMRVSRAEFAHLFFPESVFMRPPYELDPDVLWMQIDAGSISGLRRMISQHAGVDLEYAGLVCRPPQEHGRTRLHGCDVRRASTPADTITERMFGAILERDGQFKFLSLGN